MATAAIGQDESDDEFEDAWEDLPPPTLEIGLSQGIEQARVALNLFLNNKFEDAKNSMEPYASKSMYHALAYGTIMYLQAAMTLESAHLDKAVQVVRSAVDVCHRQRRRQTFTEQFTRSKQSKATYYDNFTDEQAHAELCYAESLLERAFLMFVQDENLIALFKGSLKIRECYRSYKECWKILMHRKWKDEGLRREFESGTRTGIGAFNLMLSMLPSRILKILEVVGFSGNKKFGLSQMYKSTSLHGTLRAPLCALMLLAYHTFITHMLGLELDMNLKRCRDLLQPCMEAFPNGAMFLFFRGRIDLVSGDIPSAIRSYHESIDSQSEWKQMHHICYWELLFSHAFTADWLLAMKYAERLSHESRWSKATYMYQKASFLMMCLDEQSEGSRNQMQNHINGLLEAIPNLVQRIAGKSIPIEKFALKKTKRYMDQGKWLTLPALELIYIWNGFNIIGKSPEHLDKMLQIVENTINSMMTKKAEMKFFHDDYCLAMLLKGVCLKHQDKTIQAEMCFREILDIHKNLKYDLYLLPWTEVELALLAISAEKWSEARKRIDKAKSYKGYSLESRLHFRMHAITLYIKARLRGDPLDDYSMEDVEDLDALETDTGGAEPPPEPVDASRNDSNGRPDLLANGSIPKFEAPQ